MNEYQEALRRIAFNYGLSALDGDTNEIMDDNFNEDMKVIKELVDKETPMKPKNKYKIDFGVGNCGDCLKCESLVNYQMAYCPGCGQKIDWSDDNE